jgi:hypothetical protein
MIRKIKDPNATLDYVVDFTDWIEETASNDKITSVQWIVPTGLSMMRQSFTETTATVWLSGGTVKKVYQVTCRITTDGGRIEDFSFELQCAEK